MEKIMYFSQHAERPSNPREKSALYEAGYGLHDRGTNKGWMRSRSYYTKATKRPIVSAAVLAGLACAWAAVKRSR